MDDRDRVSEQTAVARAASQAVQDGIKRGDMTEASDSLRVGCKAVERAAGASVSIAREKPRPDVIAACMVVAGSAEAMARAAIMLSAALAAPPRELPTAQILTRSEAAEWAVSALDELAAQPDLSEDESAAVHDMSKQLARLFGFAEEPEPEPAELR